MKFPSKVHITDITACKGIERFNYIDTDMKVKLINSSSKSLFSGIECGIFDKKKSKEQFYDVRNVAQRINKKKKITYFV